jgi:hypothetical protein
MIIVWVNFRAKVTHYEKKMSVILQYLIKLNSFAVSKPNNMKKVLSLMAVAGFVALSVIGCGPSAEEKAAAEQRIKDSIAEVEHIKAEEAAAAQMKATEDSLALVAAQQAIADSIAAADSAKAAQANKPKPKPKPKPAPQPTKPEEVKPGQGRG